jgi:hypothetical protein
MIRKNWLSKKKALLSPKSVFFALTRCEHVKQLFGDRGVDAEENISCLHGCLLRVGDTRRANQGAAKQGSAVAVAAALSPR